MSLGFCCLRQVLAGTVQSWLMAFLLLGAWSSHGDVKSASKLVETHKPSLGCSLDLVRYKFKYLHIPLSLARYWAKPSAKSFCPQWGYDKTMDTGKREDHSQESCPSCIHTSNSKTNYHHSTIIIIIFNATENRGLLLHWY